MTESKKQRGYDEETDCGGLKRNGEPCELPKGWGTPHVGIGRCRKHGGNTPTHVAHGELAKAEHVARTLGLPIETNPFDALANSLAISNGIVEHFRREVERIDVDCEFVRPTSILRRPLNEGKDGENAAIEIEEITEAPLDLHIALKALDLWLKNRDKTAKMILDNGLAERLVKLQEGAAEQLMLFARGLVEALGFKPEDARIRVIVEKQLKAVDAETTAEEI